MPDLDSTMRTAPRSGELQPVLAKDGLTVRLVGLGGVVLVLATRLDGSGLTGNFWLVIALLLPLFFAIEGILASPTNYDLLLKDIWRRSSIGLRNRNR